MTCWMVGDRSYDVTGSASFGISCIGVLWGYGTESELIEAGAAHLVADPAELPAAHPEPLTPVAAPRGDSAESSAGRGS